MLNCCGRSVAKKKKPNSSNMGLTVTEDTPADMLAGNMELLVQLPPRSDNDYDDDYEEEEEALHHQHHRNHRDRHHNHHHNNGHHPRRATTNGINARRVTVARSTPMMDLLVQVATSQKLSASSYTLEAIGEHGLVLTHHPNTPIGALDALQVKLLPKQGTFAPVKTRHANQPFEPTFRLQVHLPRNQLYVSRVSSRMNLGKILEEVCREKNLDRSNYELCHPANLEEKLDLSLSLQDYHLQEVTLCPKRRSLGSSLSSQDIMALQRQEERRRQDARHTVFGFAFKKSKESSVSTDSLGERSISPARSDGTGRSASPLQVPTAPPTRPQRKRRPAPKPPIQQEQHPDLDNGAKETGKEREIEKEKIVVISHSRNSSDSSGYHEASVLSDNLDSNIRIPETLPRRSKAQPQPLEPPPRTLAESSQASKSLGNLAFVPTNNRASIARGTSNTSLVSTGLRKKKAAPAPPQPRPLSSAISTQALERIVDSEESLTSGGDSPPAKASSDVAATCRPSLVTSQSLSSDDSEPITVTISKMETENNDVANPPSPEVLKKEETGVVEKPTPKKRSTVVQPFVAIAETGDQFDVAETATEIVTHNVEPARDRKRAPTANDGRNDLTAPITDAEATSELLKKVSDTLSGSSRSPAVALISTSGNVSPKEQQQIKVCVDAPGESKIRINQPQTIADDNLTRRDVTNSSEKSLDEKTIESNVADDPGRTEIEDSLRDSVQNESLAAAETTDWEYQLPEPPTAFRDTEDNENRKGSSTISLEKRSADVESTDSAVNTDTEISNNAVSSTSDEKTKSRKNDEVSATRSPKTSTSVNEAINSDTNFQTRTLDSATLERGRVSRSRPVKPLGDSAARRPSHAVSTPSVAPVDNPLSNFTITTYSRPKPVEILNEIEQRDDELQPGILGRKGSAGQTELFAAVPQQNRRHTATAIFVTKNASQSSKTYMTLPRNEKSAQPEIPPKKIEPAEGEVMKEIDDQQVQINSDANNTNVSRSNVRISIVTKPRPRANTLTDIVLSKNQTFDVINGNETVGSSEEQRKDSAPESYDKSSQSGESILNKQETPDKEKQLQSLEILKSISPQLDDARKTSRDDGMSENTDSVTSKETRSQNDVKNEPPTDENPKNSVPATVENTKPSEPKMKRYTYSGPPAIDLGSWSERSRTKVQIKPDSDYKFEKSKSPEIITPAQTTPAPIIRESPSNAGPKIGTTSVIIQNETPTPVFPVQPVGITAAKNSRFERDRAAEIDNRDRKESNELAKTLIARTTATGFTRRPVSAVFEPSGVSTLTRLRKKEPEEEKVVGAQGRLHNQTPEKDEIDSTPINFKQLKETFGKEQLTNSQSRPNYGTYGRPKSEYNTSGSAVRRDSNVVLSNGESEKVAPVSNYSTLQRISTIGPARVMSGAENTKVHEKPSSISSQEKRNFVVSTNRLGYNQVSEATGPGGVRRTSRGNLMPVVKGFKVTTLEGEGAATLPNNKDKQPNNYGRVAIGDISNGNYVATHNGLKKTVVQIRGDDFTNGIPKPPPTMPVITGVTLKSTNANNSRPKSIGGQADPRSELLEAIKGFGGTSQLRRVPRRSMNISGIQI
ncbi:cordon-bleu protein-like 1 isoform X6 [Athalia rosae]|uniref:cordon-bleu protein-like 1 isoform X6 n=1 Tax=Athalia rosae TaxID=37344 RepID=UPI00203394E0|nr:cordon-bleu protein-like 1 isoform X6 [Athalia rosae]